MPERADSTTITPLAVFFSVLVLVGLWSPLPAWGAKLATVDVGYGRDDTRLVRLNFAIGNPWHRQANEDWRWHYAWEANVSYWFLDRVRRGEKTLAEIGFTPNFRLERGQPTSWGRPYLELGIGVHLLSRSHIGERDMSSAFQFGSHIGTGVSFGSREQYELAWRIEHLSNGGLRSPNPGIDFIMVRLGYRW